MGAAALIFFMVAIVTQIVFVLLRIFHIIDWNAVWILMPMIVIGGLLLLLLCFLIFYVLLVRPDRTDEDDV